MGYGFGAVLAFVVVAVGFAAVALTIGKMVRPNHPEPAKSMIYECGEVPIGNAWMNFNPRFYLIALVFVIFEVESVLLFAIGPVLKTLGWLALWEVGGFVALVTLGLFYAWRRGALVWR